MIRAFPLAPVLSAHTGRLLCGIVEYREFLDHMAGRHVWLWEIVTVQRQIAFTLKTRYPGLKLLPIPPEKTDSGAAAKYVKACGKQLQYNDIRLMPLSKKLPEIKISEVYV